MEKNRWSRVVEFFHALGQFAVAVLFQLAVPLLPLGFEFWKTGRIVDKSSTLAAAMYAISTGVASDGLVLFALGIVISIVFAFAYGDLQGEGQQPGLAGEGLAALVAIGFVFVFDFFQRLNRHVGKREPFLQFRTGKP
jgi:hypothetical protein